MVKIRKKPELLAPAGNLNKLKTALAFGADAVYFGLPEFSLRVRINDFNWNDLKKGIELTHQAGKKAYITLNIFAHNYHLQKASEHILRLKKLKPDALFVSDPAMVDLIKKLWPEVRLSLSTQANCTNWQSAKFWSRQGISRIILGRELSLKEIKEIKAKVPKTEIEVFVHGALCSAYSGRCFLSDYYNERSANLGDCSQPCRWEYEIQPAGHDKKLILSEDEHGTNIMNSKDLCLIERLPEIIEAGVDALKIEGRAKSAYYLANVVGAYRQAIDLMYSKKTKAEQNQELNFLRGELEQKLSHRGYCEGFMFRSSDSLQNTSGVNFVPDWEFCGQVLSCKAGKGFYDLKIKVHNTLKVGDKLEIVAPPYQVEALVLEKITDAKTGKDLKEVHGGSAVGGEVIIRSDKPFPAFSVIRRRL